MLLEVSKKMKRSQEPRMPSMASWRVGNPDPSTPQSLVENTLGSNPAAGRVTPEISVIDSDKSVLFVNDASTLSDLFRRQGIISSEITSAVDPAVASGDVEGKTSYVTSRKQQPKSTVSTTAAATLRIVNKEQLGCVQHQHIPILADSRVTVTGSYDILSQPRRQLGPGVAMHDGEVRILQRSTVSYIIHGGGDFTNGSSSACSNSGCTTKHER